MNVRAWRAGAPIACMLVAALVASAGASPRLLFPFWSVRDDPRRTIGCAQLAVWISKSGKEGFGLSVVVTTEGARCDVTLDSAEAAIGRERVAGVNLPPTLRLGAHEAARGYVPFPFDNESAWNRGDRDGTLALSVRAGDARETWTVRLVEAPMTFAQALTLGADGGAELELAAPDGGPAVPR